MGGPAWASGCRWSPPPPLRQIGRQPRGRDGPPRPVRTVRPAVAWFPGLYPGQSGVADHVRAVETSRPSPSPQRRTGLVAFVELVAVEGKRRPPVGAYRAHRGPPGSTPTQRSRPASISVRHQRPRPASASTNSSNPSSPVYPVRRRPARASRTEDSTLQRCRSAAGPTAPRRQWRPGYEARLRALALRDEGRSDRRCDPRSRHVTSGSRRVRDAVSMPRPCPHWRRSHRPGIDVALEPVDDDVVNDQAASFVGQIRLYCAASGQRAGGRHLRTGAHSTPPASRGPTRTQSRPCD